MWHTPIGDRVLTGAEATLIKAAATAMAELIHEECSDFNDQWQYGIELFDSLTWTQRLMLLDQVATFLLTRTANPLGLNAVNEATVGAVFEHVCIEIDLEIDGVSESGRGWRHLVLAAYRERSARDQEFTDDDAAFDVEPPDATCRDRDRWRDAVETLADGILWDRDYEMPEQFLDQPPEQATRLRQFLGITDDYFSDAAPDADSPAIVERVLHRLTTLAD